MARGGRGDITGNVPGQGFTSPSPCTHVQGAYGAPTGAGGGAANGRRTTVGGTADGTRRSTVGTLNMGTWAGTGEALAWYIASDVPSTSPSQGSNSGAHRES